MILSRNILRIVLLGGIFLLVSTGTLKAGQGLVITVKEEATVRGEEITLGDIAIFSPQDDARVGQLRRMEVGTSPYPGSRTRLTSHFLAYKIGSAIADDPTVSLKIPVSLLIKRTAQYLSANELKDIFKNHILKNSPWSRDKIVFDRINTPGRMALPEGKLRWQVLERGDPDYVGNVFLTVDFRVNDRQVRKVALSGRISIKQEVVKTTRKIGSGEVISEGDLILLSESSSGRDLGDVLTRIEDAVGKRTIRNIQEGHRVTRAMIEEPPMVKRGKRVIIRAMSQSIQVTTLGKVLEDGRAGDQVKVMNISSGREILATVAGPGVVQVYF